MTSANAAESRPLSNFRHAADSAHEIADERAYGLVI
jgi:hypothetical protein